jgi:hypothetical protein
MSNDMIQGLLAYMKDKQRTQQMQGLAGLLESTGIPQTVERSAYAQSPRALLDALTNVNRANVPLLKAETADALMTLVPVGGASAKAAERGAMAVGRAGERVAERVVPQVMERGGKSAQLLEDLAQGTRSQIFIGKTSKSWNEAAEKQALKMEKAGEKPEDIWMATGTFRGPDKKLRQEISDKESKITEKVHEDIMAKSYFNDPMSSALTHEKLYQAYPEMKDINTTIVAWEQPKGSFSKLRNEIEASGPSSMHQRSTALHELQHAIQQKEGFAGGGSPRMFQPDDVFSSQALEDAAILDKTMRANNFNQLEAKNRFTELFKRNPTPGSFAALERIGTGKELEAARDAARLADDPMDSYRRLAGEAEARAIQKRRNLTEDERKAEFPFRSYDVPIDQLIFRGLLD